MAEAEGESLGEIQLRVVNDKKQTEDTAKATAKGLAGSIASAIKSALTGGAGGLSRWAQGAAAGQAANAAASAGAAAAGGLAKLTPVIAKAGLVVGGVLLAGHLLMKALRKWEGEVEDMSRSLARVSGVFASTKALEFVRQLHRDMQSAARLGPSYARFSAAREAARDQTQVLRDFRAIVRMQALTEFYRVQEIMARLAKDIIGGIAKSVSSVTSSVLESVGVPKRDQHDFLLRIARLLTFGPLVAILEAIQKGNAEKRQQDRVDSVSENNRMFFRDLQALTQGSWQSPIRGAAPRVPQPPPVW